MQRRLPLYLSILLLLGLSFPMLQELTGMAYIPPLRGIVLRDSTQTDHSWWTRGLQKDLETASTDSLSMRPGCIRLRNQLEYSLTGKLNAQDIYAYDNDFYRMTYINFAEDQEFEGYKKIERQAKQLKALQERTGKPVYVIIAPTKLHYSIDKLPAYNKTNSRKTNYYAYKKALLKKGIAVLDADQWFVNEKRKGHRPKLMANGGVHWTLYGGALALDSLIKRCSNDLKMNYQRVQMQFDPSDNVYPGDLDAVDLSNLLFPPKEKGLKLVHFPPVQQPKKRLYPLVVSDSYFNIISWTPLHDQVLDEKTPFYYYFQTRFDRSDSVGKPIDLKELKADLRNADCILIICNVQNLSQFGYGFIEETHALFFGH